MDEMTAVELKIIWEPQNACSIVQIAWLGEKKKSERRLRTQCCAILGNDETVSDREPKFLSLSRAESSHRIRPKIGNKNW